MTARTNCNEIRGYLELQPVGEQLDETTHAFEETAALIRNLDLVVTVDTAVAHVAGALGTPTWLAWHSGGDWRWLLNREDSPWYDSVRIFRQEEPGNWAPVFQRMSSSLGQFADGLIEKAPEEFRLSAAGPNRTVAARHGVYTYNSNDTYVGRSLENYGEWSEEELATLLQLIRPEDTVVEVGANIGTHTVPLARRVGETGGVIAFEPQRRLYQCLCGNVAQNGLANVRCMESAVGDHIGQVTYRELDYETEDNFSGLAMDLQLANGTQVAMTTIDALALERCDLIKADAQGMELAVLQGSQETIRRHHPSLYVENEDRTSSPELIQLMHDLGYQIYWHLPKLYSANNFFRNQNNVFGSTVSANMIGVHTSRNAAMHGFRRVTDVQDFWDNATEHTIETR